MGESPCTGRNVVTVAFTEDSGKLSLKMLQKEVMGSAGLDPLYDCPMLSYFGEGLSVPSLRNS